VFYCQPIFSFQQKRAINYQKGLLSYGLLLVVAFIFFFEGYFCLNYVTLAGDSSLFGELWKEYSLSDSRYLTGDSFVLWMEAITALCWGPLCFTNAYFIYTDNPKRHLGIVIASMGQIYGDVLYYMTTLFEGSPHTRPEPYYFWVYFVMMNAFWIFIPAGYVIDSSSSIFRALSNTTDTKLKKK